MKKIQLCLNGKSFHPKHTFENGQCFRWIQDGDEYIGVVDEALVRVKPKGRDFIAEVLLGSLEMDRLKTYFDCETDYLAMEALLSQKDPWLEKAFKIGSGLRLLRQDPFEMLMTFIISSNNNIPKIRLSVEDLCARYGKLLGTYKGIDYYTFPTLDVLAQCSEDDLKVKAIGYRAKSLYKTLEKLKAEAIDLSIPFGLDLEDGIEWLKQFYGVGDKVAQCILLFGYGKEDAYPIDTWVKQMLKELYGVEKNQKAFIETYFGDHRGFAQQVLFYYMRNYYAKGHVD